MIQTAAEILNSIEYRYPYEVIIAETIIFTNIQYPMWSSYVGVFTGNSFPSHNALYNAEFVASWVQLNTFVFIKNRGLIPTLFTGLFALRQILETYGEHNFWEVTNNKHLQHVYNS